MAAYSLSRSTGRTIVALLLITSLATWAASSNERSADETPHRIPIAIIDVAKVFKQAKQFNAEMEKMKVAIETFDREVRRRMSGTESPDEVQKEIAAKKKDFLEQEAKVYAETYSQIERKLSEICHARDVGIVIRYTSDPMNVADRNSVLQGVNRPVVYWNVPDLTADVLTALDN